MTMEEENVCSTLFDATDSVLPLPQPDSWTSIDHQYINGERQANMWGETEVQINQTQDAVQLSESPKEGRDSPEEAEPWEQIMWPVRPMSCISPPLSFATVQWDMPDLTAEASSLRTDISTANELDAGAVTSVDSTSPSLYRFHDVNAEFFTEEIREEEGGIDSQLVSSDSQKTGNNVEPCDAADVQDPAAQEKEESTHTLSECNNELPLRADFEKEEEHSAASDPVETVDFIDILEETEGSEDEADGFVDLRFEEEPVVLLTGHGDSGEERCSQRGPENEEGDEVEGEKSVTELCPGEESEETKCASGLTHVGVLAEPLQSVDTGSLVCEAKLQQSELLEERQSSENEEDTELVEQSHGEDPTEQSEEPEMCRELDLNVDTKRSEAGQENQDVLILAADNAETVENSHEVQELTENLEETDCLQQKGCDQPKLSLQLEHLTEEPEQIQAEERHPEDRLRQQQHLDQSPQMESTQPENADLPEERTLSEQTICVVAEHPGVAGNQDQTEPSEQKEQTIHSSQTALSGQPVQTAEAEVNHVDKQAETSHPAEVGGSEGGSVPAVVANGTQPKPLQTAVPHANGCEVDREMARRLAERLFKLDGIQCVDVVKHLDKDNDFSRAVGEEYLKFFDFTGQTLDHALRSFLKVVVLIGETQERERVLQHFACRYHQCNHDSFSSSGSVLALTCALMLLNTDLHGQNVGKSMSSSKFVSNLDGMNEGENFSKDLLKSLYNSIRSEPLEWAIDEGELMSSVFVDDEAADVALLRSKTNPFQDVPHDKKATEVKEGLLQRKLHADVDGKRTPWGKRGWKTFNGVLKGMVLYLQKVDYRRDHMVNEEVVSVHHSLAEPAADYTKKPHVFRLQTADWRVFLFQASCKVEMNSWISRINLVSALHSSPPFPAAVGSQRRFFRPILPASQSAHSLERQLQSHSGMLESFKTDLSHLQENLPVGKKAKARELEEHRVRAEYLRHEMCRYETYIQMLETWRSVKKTDDNMLSSSDLSLFDKAVCADSVGEEEEEEGLKKSHSSPALELEIPPQTMIKVKRNISERRTYRRPIIQRLNKEA